MTMLTKTEQTEQYLRNAIRTGRWLPGEPLPSERRLLKELGISRTTLRNVMYALAKDGLIIRKHGSGTCIAPRIKKASIAILGRASQFSSTVGHTYRLMIEEAQRIFGDFGYRPVLYIGNGQSVDEFASSVNLFDEPMSKDNLGVLALTDTAGLEKRFTEKGLACVSVRPVMPFGKYCVTLDYVSMCQMAAEKLNSHGYHDFAVICTDYSSDPLYNLSKQLYEFQWHLANQLVGFDSSRIVPVKYNLNYDNAYDAFKKWLTSSGRPNAIFFLDDALFERASIAILELGINVPDELAIMTHANLQRSLKFPFQVCRIGFDIVQGVTAGCNMLNKLVSGEQIDNPIVYIQPEIQEGESL